MSGDFFHTARRLLTSRVALVFSILLCAFIFFQLIQVVSKSAQTGKQIATLKTQVDSLQTEQKRLDQLRSFLQTDFFAEQEARTKFGLQKEGEHALVISKESGGPQMPSTIPAVREGAKAKTGSGSHGDSVAENYSAGESDKKNYQRWWQYFFGHE